MGRSVHSAPYQEFLKRLREARLAAGLSQADVAKKVGKPQSFISKCESGERRVDVVEAVAFCALYGVAIEDLVGQRRRGARGGAV